MFFVCLSTRLPENISADNMDPTLLQVNAAQRRVQQMMSVAPQQFEELIVCHVSRRLELDGDKLDEFINGKGKTSGKRNSLKKIASPFQRKSSKQESEKENGLQVSSQIVNAISKLILSLHNAHDLREEGLFRKTGGITRQRELKQQILDDCSLCLNPYTTHDRASVIKHLLSDIPEPLLMTRHFEAFRQALGQCSMVKLKVITFIKLINSHPMFQFLCVSVFLFLLLEQPLSWNVSTLKLCKSHQSFHDDWLQLDTAVTSPILLLC